MIVRLRSRLLIVAAALAVVAVVGFAITGVLDDHGPGLPALWIAVFAIAAVAAWIAVTVARAHLRELARAIRRVADDPSRRVPLEWLRAERDELHAIATAVNAMADAARRNERSLARDRVVLAAVADGLNQGVIAIDRERKIELINDAARAMLGVARAPVGESLIELVRVPEVFQLLSVPTAGEAEVQLPACARVLIRVPRLGGGEGRVLLLEDVTAMRRLETMRRDFVANVSHELRTPVAVIRANAETLIAGASGDAVMGPKLIDGLHRNAERLARILADLLDLARLDAGQYPMELSPLPIAPTVEQALTSIEPLASSREVTITVAIASDLEVVADAKALDQIVVNLVDNAVKYTRAAGNVWIEARDRGDEVRLEVRDDGPGISEAHRARIFERFYRADPSRSREAGGTGLGLSIVKHLVERMGGTVGVEPNARQGSIFWVHLPKGPVP